MKQKTGRLEPLAFRGEADHDQVQAFIRERHPVTGLPDYWNSGMWKLGIYLNLFESHPTDHTFWWDKSGTIQAYTYLSPIQSTVTYHTPQERMWRIQVHPGWRSTELALRMLEHAEDTLSKRNTEQSPLKPISTRAYLSDSWSISLLESRGYFKGSCQDVYMRVDLAREPAKPRIRPGFLVREFKGELEIAQRAGAQRHTYEKEPEADDWGLNNTRRTMRHREGRDDFDLVVASEAGDIVSYAYCSIDPVTGAGEFEMVGTRLSHRRQGFSRAVLLTGLQEMKERGMGYAVVRTEAGNAPAQRLYESVGFRLTDQLYSFSKVP
jgi:ribosomal protein S18 acetylase RimI-like enzyme